MSDGLIYHYTTLAALEGMIHHPTYDEMAQSSDTGDHDCSHYLVFHASDIRMMNDRRENILLQAILGKVSQCERLLAQRVVFEKPYSISFCEIGEYIPMWKMYAHSGVGICLEFSSEDIEAGARKINRPDIDRLEYGECEYLTKKRLRKRINAGVAEWKRFCRTIGPGVSVGEIYSMACKIMLPSVFCKLDCFKYEHEVRLIGFSSSEARTKTLGYGIRLYKEICVPLSLLKGIIISPFNENPYCVGRWITELLEPFDSRIYVQPSRLRLR